MIIQYKAVEVDEKYVHIAASGIAPAPGFTHRFEKAGEGKIRFVATPPKDQEYDLE